MMRVLFCSPLKGRWIGVPVLNGHFRRCRPGNAARDYQSNVGCRVTSGQGASLQHVVPLVVASIEPSKLVSVLQIVSDQIHKVMSERDRRTPSA